MTLVWSRKQYRPMCLELSGEKREWYMRFERWIETRSCGVLKALREVLDFKCDGKPLENFEEKEATCF